MVTVPPLPTDGRSPRMLESGIRSWLDSPPFWRLGEASGWTWPEEADNVAFAGALASLSEDWNFRGNTRERNLIGHNRAIVNGREIPDGLVFEAARELGLMYSASPPPIQFDNVLVLSGLVRGCVNRTNHAANLVRRGLNAGSVFVLGGHRRLTHEEVKEALHLGFGQIYDEADIVVAATRRAFGLDAPQHVDASDSNGQGDWTGTLWAKSERYCWPELEVVISPSGDAARRRANTSDQLQHWAHHANISKGNLVLIITTQIYLPYQHLDALRVLGLGHGCSIYSSGVDEGNASISLSDLSGRSYLQELRSALRAAKNLLEAARNAELSDS